MKLIYEPGEIERLEEVRSKCIKNGYMGRLFDDKDPDRMYGLTFKVTNHALAEYILIGLLHNKLDEFDIGIDVQSIEFDVLGVKRSEVRKKLINAINEIV